ncbi:hypothetical protein [Vibrio mediterranei]|uniref:hypothetical protein n=1 Tax=Vibrio mediterranei TaxID=689 RepID=UPI00148BA9F9|nr:hypothetical protein [Vibrio mediterranei]NOH29670.1 hypothetical protein [Vibrio mediterranei]
MNIKDFLLATTALTSFFSQAAFYAVVQVPKASVGADPNIPTLTVTKDSELSTTGTYEVKNAKLITQNKIYSADGCEVYLDGDEYSGTFHYIDAGCSELDQITFLADQGLMETIPMWNSQKCNPSSNDWLQAAYDGIDGLVYNSRSCSLNGSRINYVMSRDTIPATYLYGIDIDVNLKSLVLPVVLSTPTNYEEFPPDWGSPPPPGLGEGETDIVFTLDRIQVVYGDIKINHDFINEINMQSLIYMTGNSIEMKGIVKIKEFSFPELRHYGGNVIDLNFFGSMEATKIEIPHLRYLGVLDLRYMIFNDLSNFGNIRQAYIEVGPTEFPDYKPFTKFPSRSSDFCRGVRQGDIMFSEAQTQTNAMNSCSY